MSHSEAAEHIALRALLSELTHNLGAPLTPAWDKAYWAVPRHRFLPDRIRRTPDYAPIDRKDAPERWLWAAYSDEPAVIQLNDGDEPMNDDDRWPSSSASAPSLVFRVLDLLDVEDGHKVLEIGTGTGWNAGLLAHRVGPGNVTSVEVDPLLAVQAAENLRAAGLDAQVVFGDGADGHPEDAPYDRVLATCAVRAVPYAWIEQTAPSGIVLAPWETPWLSHGLLRLTVEGDGTASGWFTPHPACMPLRAHRTDPRILRDVVRDEDQPEETTTGVSPCAVTGDNWNARFAIGLQTRDISHTWQHDPGIDGVTSRLWLTTTDATSRAAIDPDPENPEGPEDGERFTIHQHGPRRLWDEVTAALTWWHQAGSPGPERFGMTVQPDGTHHAWLDTPDRPVPRTG